jgi:hypothetical protein
VAIVICIDHWRHGVLTENLYSDFAYLLPVHATCNVSVRWPCSYSIGQGNDVLMRQWASSWPLSLSTPSSSLTEWSLWNLMNNTGIWGIETEYDIKYPTDFAHYKKQYQYQSHTKYSQLDSCGFIGVDYTVCLVVGSTRPRPTSPRSDFPRPQDSTRAYWVHCSKTTAYGV